MIETISSSNFVAELNKLDILDSRFGDDLNKYATTELISKLEILLSHYEGLIETKNSSIQEYSEWINRIYMSERYRIGTAVVKPIESIYTLFRKLIRSEHYLVQQKTVVD